MVNKTWIEKIVKLLQKDIIVSWINIFFNYDPNTWKMEITAKRIIAWLHPIQTLL